jgi:hypothetical protein
VNAYPAAARGPLPPPLQLLGVVLGAPFAVLGGGIRLLRRTLGFGAAVAGAVASRVLPARLSAVLGRAGRAVSAAGRDLQPAAAAAEFAQHFTGACIWLRSAALHCEVGSAAVEEHGAWAQHQQHGPCGRHKALYQGAASEKPLMNHLIAL